MKSQGFPQMSLERAKEALRMLPHIQEIEFIDLEERDGKKWGVLYRLTMASGDFKLERLGFPTDVENQRADVARYDAARPVAKGIRALLLTLEDDEIRKLALDMAGFCVWCGGDKSRYDGVIERNQEYDPCYCRCDD